MARRLLTMLVLAMLAFAWTPVAQAATPVCVERGHDITQSPSVGVLHQCGPWEDVSVSMRDGFITICIKDKCRSIPIMLEKEF